ncbi:MAG TPA: sugar ABC transporter substrate-binding protein [Firmicutes bacterium]|nr:sugar ABC transporter substrate-binding protein [Bacillota bacterium]
MKRYTMVLFVLLVALVSLCFTGTIVVNAASKITVIMPRHEMDLIGIWEKQTKEFEAKTGTQVEFIQMSWDEVADKVLTDLAAGGNSYDVIEFDNGWVAKFAATGWVSPLNDIADKQYVNSLLPGLVSTFTRNGKLLGIPWNNDTRFFFYNKTLLQKAGFNTPPRTWAEVVTQAKALKKAGICEYPIAEYWNQEWALANSVAFYLYSYGGNYFNNKGQITINKSPSLDAITFMVDMIKKEKLVNPSSTTLSQEAAADLFYRGSSAFFFQGPPSTFSYANDPKKSKVVGQIEVAPWLPGKTASLQTTLTLPEAFSIPKGSKNRELAWKYIQFMISKEKDKDRAMQIGSLPLFKDLYKDDQLLKKYPYWKQFGQQSLVAKPLPLVEWYDELVQKTIVSVQQALLGTRTPKAATDDIADFLNGKVVDGKKLSK